MKSDLNLFLSHLNLIWEQGGHFFPGEEVDSSTGPPRFPLGYLNEEDKGSSALLLEVCRAPAPPHLED